MKQEMTPEDKAKVLAALQKLYPAQHQVVEMHMRGFTQGQIAVLLGMTQGNVSRTLKRGLKTLEALKKRHLERSRKRA